MNASEINALNEKFVIPGIAEIVPGNGGLAKIRVTSPAASAEIYLLGAQATSWMPAGADEVLFFERCIALARGSSDPGRNSHLLSVVSR